MAGKVGRKHQMTADEKAELVSRLLSAKSATGKSFDEIAKELGLTNAYTVQLFMRQAQLKPESAVKLSKSVPFISPEDLLEMQQCPMRSFDPNIMQEPLIYRLVEAMQHYGESIKIIVNEKLGDGIMSAIDLYLTVDSVKGVAGEDRVVVTMNGKYLPHIEQLANNNTANTF